MTAPSCEGPRRARATTASPCIRPGVRRGRGRARFGPQLLHVRFQDAGKDWRWLYRAQASVARADDGVSIGARLVDAIARPPERTKKEWFYWGDLADGVSDGYGMCLRLPSRHCAVAPHPARSAAHDLHIVDDMGVAGAARSYEGQWKDGRYHGRGVHIDGSGTRYEGDWKEGQRHGYAVAHYKGIGVYRAIGKTMRGTATARPATPSVPPTRATGGTACVTAAASIPLPRAPPTTATGRTGARKAMASAATPSVPSTRANGKRTYATAKARSSARRAAGTGASSVAADDGAGAPTAGPTARGTRAHGPTTGSVVSACASLPTADESVASGRGNGNRTSPPEPSDKQNKKRKAIFPLK
ncbi:morn repeat domain containing protein [Pandoravirus japonicus]|uniref:Morn repeat domain containing protein n=1 Tax=Pandoravirus japonicus TaxID=2823154 RepID=A0A811BLI9_9VIRU|nr:morn repeat domain containing protein [Pandoravirus japonicus]